MIAEFDGRVFTRCRPQFRISEVVGSAPHGMNVKLLDGTRQQCDVPEGLYRVVRVHDDGFEIAPHTPTNRGDFRGWIGEPKYVRRNR